MRLRSTHLIVLLTLWLALLQAVAPLLHAHANGDNPLDDGPHLHLSTLALQSEEVRPDHPFHWHVHANKSSGTIIGLTPTITEETWQLSDPEWQLVLTVTLISALLIWLTAVAHQAKPRLEPPWRRLPIYAQTAVPRAPPHA